MAGKVNPAPEDNVGHPSSTIALRPTKRHIGNKARSLCSPASEAIDCRRSRGRLPRVHLRQIAYPRRAYRSGHSGSPSRAAAAPLRMLGVEDRTKLKVILDEVGAASR